MAVEPTTTTKITPISATTSVVTTSDTVPPSPLTNNPATERMAITLGILIAAVVLIVVTEIYANANFPVVATGVFGLLGSATTYWFRLNGKSGQ